MDCRRFRVTLNLFRELAVAAVGQGPELGLEVGLVLPAVGLVGGLVMLGVLEGGLLVRALPLVRFQFRVVKLYLDRSRNLMEGRGLPRPRQSPPGKGYSG